jgi:hypothetical protein
MEENTSGRNSVEGRVLQYDWSDEEAAEEEEKPAEAEGLDSEIGRNKARSLTGVYDV